MMYVVSSTGSEEVVHVGQRVETKVEDVVEVQADGDELDYIVESFRNIPYNYRNRVQRWFGDAAKFIVANLY